MYFADEKDEDQEPFEEEVVIRQQHGGVRQLALTLVLIEPAASRKPFGNDFYIRKASFTASHVCAQVCTHTVYTHNFISL